MSLTGDFPQLLLVGKVLSGVMLLIFLGVLVNLWRHPSLPDLSYGGITLAWKRMRWLWFLFLTGALATGVSGDPVVSNVSTFTDAVESATDGQEQRAVQSSLSLPLPFYRYERERRSVDGRLVEETVVEAMVIPWELLSALVVYYFLVLKWDPENRWARRILEGKRKRTNPPA